jgi:hypothetical protein
MTDFNDIGISHKLDWPCIAHLFRVNSSGGIETLMKSTG